MLCGSVDLTIYHGLQLSGVVPTRFVNTSVKGGETRSTLTRLQDEATQKDVQTSLQLPLGVQYVSE